MAYSPYLTTDQKGIYPDQTFNYYEAVPEALIVNPLITTVAGVIEGDRPLIRVPYVKTDPTSGFVAEGAEIPDGGGVLDEVLVSSGKIALLLQQSNESRSFQSAEELISAGVSRSIMNRADALLLGNNPTGDDMTPKGLLHVDGITEVTTPEAGIVDAVADAKATIGANGGDPTAIVVGYQMDATLRKLKDTTGKGLLIDPTHGGDLTLHGLPVIVNQGMENDSILIVSAKEVVAAVGRITLTDSDSAVFNRDSVQRRATWRIGWKPVHANRLAKISVTSSK